MARTTMTTAMMMKMMITVLTCASMLLPRAQGSTDNCRVPGNNNVNSGGNCNFDDTTLTLCEWQNMERNNKTWRGYFNDVNFSPCVVTYTEDLRLNQIVRLSSPLLCATNSSFYTYQLHFVYSIFDSDLCRFSLSVYSALGDKLIAELWNTQEKTFDARSNGWMSQSISVTNSDGSFYLIFAIDRRSSSKTTFVALDSLRYTSTLITTTPATTTTTPASTSNLTSPTPPSTTTSSTTTTTPTPTTPTTTVSTSFFPASSTTAPDSTLLWGLSRDVVIAIGVAIVVFIVLILVIAIICRRVRKEEEVKTVSFALASPTAYNVNEEKKSTGKRRREMKARASVLVPSKHSNWEPDRSLY